MLAEMACVSHFHFPRYLFLLPGQWDFDWRPVAMQISVRVARTVTRPNVMEIFYELGYSDDDLIVKIVRYYVSNT
jgi:hypothetical protein